MVAGSARFEKTGPQWVSWLFHLRPSWPLVLLGASKAEASKAAHRIITMEDSLQKTNCLIKLAECELTLDGKTSGNNETVDISLSPEDLRLRGTADQLQKTCSQYSSSSR